MKDFSYNDIKEASEEVFRMRENSKFHADDYEKYKCNCRFEKEEKTPSFQNGKKLCSQMNQCDDDKWLVLALILILSKNSDDKLLLFALLYQLA